MIRHAFCFSGGDKRYQFRTLTNERRRILKKLFLLSLILLAFGITCYGITVTDFEPSGFVPGTSIDNHLPDGTLASPQPLNLIESKRVSKKC